MSKGEQNEKLQDKIDQKAKHQMAIFIIYKLFTIAQLLALLVFVSVSLVRENLRGLRENLKHKIPTTDKRKCNS